jgi:signal transduction histidine kinase
MIIGVAVQYALPAYSLNPQLSLAINVVVEVSRAALCFFIFGVRWMTRVFRVDSKSLFISSAFLSLGILTIARLLTFPGMPLAGTYGDLVDTPYFGDSSSFGDSLYYDTLIRLSIGGLLLLGAMTPSDRFVKPSTMKYYPLAFTGYALLGLIVVSAFDHTLPRLYIQGEGMTPLKDYIGLATIVVTFAAALVYAWLASRSREWGYLLVSLGLLMMTEAQFSFYRVTAPLDAYLIVGRVIALAAWFVIFVGIVKPSLFRPYLNLEKAKREIDIAGENLASLSRNIMERREAEEKILALNVELELKARELEASNKGLEAFCYSVSHDLRAPLRTIDGFGRFLADEEGTRLSDRGKDYITRMRRGCERMGLIIEDLLKLSRVVREEVSFREFDISSLAKSVAQELRAADSNRNLKFLACGPEIVEGDERLLRIAIENLLQNAWKFTSKTDNATVEFGVTRADGGRVFFVRDNGAGFDMKYYDKLFRPFERLHSESEFPGTGVGLASVQRVVERHGGRVWAEGKVGEGATFYFTLGGNRPGDQVSPRP